MLRRLLLLNGFAVLFAAAHHTVDWVLTGMFWWADRYLNVTVPYYASVGGPFYSYLVVFDQIMSTAVPIFLFVSGFFMAVAGGSQKNSPGWKLVLNRVKILLWPYIIWSLMGLVYHILDGQRYTPLGIVRLLLTGGVFAPYYYVPLLMQLYLISPLLFPLVKNKPGLGFMITLITKILATLSYYVALLQLGNPSLKTQLSLFRDWHLLNYAIWFVLGIVVGQHLPHFKQLLNRYRYWFLASLLITVALTFIETTILRLETGRPWIAPQIMLSNQLLALMILLCYFAFELSLPNHMAPRIENIGRKSYGIYLIHIPVIILTARIYQKVVPGLLAYPILFQVVMFIISLAVPLLMMEITDRTFARRFYRYIFG